MNFLCLNKREIKNCIEAKVSYLQETQVILKEILIYFNKEKYLFCTHTCKKVILSYILFKHNSKFKINLNCKYALFSNVYFLIYVYFSNKQEKIITKNLTLLFFIKLSKRLKFFKYKMNTNSKSHYNNIENIIIQNALLLIIEPRKYPLIKKKNASISNILLRILYTIKFKWVSYSNLVNLVVKLSNSPHKLVNILQTWIYDKNILKLIVNYIHIAQTLKNHDVMSNNIYLDIVVLEKVMIVGNFSKQLFSLYESLFNNYKLIKCITLFNLYIFGFKKLNVKIITFYQKLLLLLELNFFINLKIQFTSLKDGFFFFDYFIKISHDIIYVEVPIDYTIYRFKLFSKHKLSVKKYDLKAQLSYKTYYNLEQCLQLLNWLGYYYKYAQKKKVLNVLFLIIKKQIFSKSWLILEQRLKI
uniref:Uncharacterized protein n=1 Tax=Compsopogon caeruleus TaxID=31354 RepID=A0A1Z1XBE9_9RHOD|nr:hypothetical protein [Compsopogon caeruleus]ARX96192.1 hypothetical protein [Compsopogon caeruleus]